MGEHRHLVPGVAVIPVVKGLLIRPQSLWVCAPTLRQGPGVLQKHPPGENDPGLLLGVPLVGISEVDPGILHHLGLNFPLNRLSVLHIRVKAEVHAPVSIHRTVPHHLPQPGGELGGLKQGRKLPVEDPGDLLQPPGGELGRGQQGSRLKGHIVRGDGGHLKQHHPLQKIEHRSGQALGLHPLPLVPDEVILIGPHRVIEPNLPLKVHRLAEPVPHQLFRHRFHASSHPASGV